MSRSYKKYPVIGNVCYKSNKKDKTFANRLFRRVSKLLLRQGKEPKHKLNEVSDTWSFASDGLPHWVNNLEKKFLRK